MKVYIHDNSRKLVRISFGYLESISFENTTLRGGTIMKRGTSELEIVRLAIHLLDDKGSTKLF